MQDKLARAKSGPQYWRSLEELAQSDGFYRDAAPRVPAPGFGLARRHFAPRLPEADERLDGAGRTCRLASSSRWSPSFPTSGSRMKSFWAIRCSSPAPCRSALTDRRCWSRATKAVPPRLKAIPIILPVWEEAIFSRKLPSSTCTIPIARRSSPTWANLDTWSDYILALKGALNAQRALKGAGLRILSRTTSSPTMASLMDQVQTAFPQSKWMQWEPVNRDNVRAGSHDGVRAIRRDALQPGEG